MQRNKSTWTKLAHSLALSVIIFGLVVGAAFADSHETPQLVNAETVHGVLPGNGAGGSYAFYMLEYPGEMADARIQLTYQADNVYSKAIGMNVYGPNDYEGNGIVQNNGAFLETSYQQDDAAALLVQVYNYTDTTVPYTLVVTGLAPKVMPTPTTDNGMEAEIETSAPMTETLTTDHSTGMIIGNAGGAFAEYVLPYETANTDVTVKMDFWPADPSYANAFGFRIWAPNGNNVATGVVPGSGVFGQLKATFSSDMTGNYIVQVTNYADGAPLNYTLTVTQ